MKIATGAFAALALIALPGAAAAQLPGGLGGLIPNVSGASAGNAAGVLSYCVKNKMLGATDASSVIGKLTGSPAVSGSKDFAQGQAGVVQTGSGKSLSLASLKGQMKTKLCDMVLQHGKSLAGL